MSQEELVGMIKEYMDGQTDIYYENERVRAAEIKGNQVFAKNVGVPVFEYLDSIYLERIKKYIEETYEERIKKLEDKVKSLEAKVK